MITIFKEEQKLVEAVIKNKPSLGKKLQEAINGIFTHLPEKLLAGYDKKLTEEFLEALVKNSADLAVEQYQQITTEDSAMHASQQKCVAPKNLEKSLFKSLGPDGLTDLIGDVLKKMAKSPFTQNDIQNLVELIKARNKLRQAQERFLKNGFKAYLKKQIEVYEK